MHEFRPESLMFKETILRHRVEPSFIFKNWYRLQVAVESIYPLYIIVICKKPKANEELIVALSNRYWATIGEASGFCLIFCMSIST